jgi:hypothetical protein
MADSFTQSSHQSWGSRIVGAFAGIVIGVILLLVSVAVLGWNEANTLDTAKSLAEGAKAVIDVEAGTVDPANNGRLVHVTGDAVTKDMVTDDVFQISAPALRLRREVEMYQWTEKESSEEKKNLGGSTETVTTYTYEKAWSRDVVDSSRFKQPQGHENPGEMTADDATFIAETVTLGAFTVPDRIVEQMPGDKPLTPAQADLDKLPHDMAKHIIKGGYYLGESPAKPTIGDERVTFEVLEPGVFSIVAAQNGATFEPYATKSGKEIERVEAGAVSAALMFKHAQDENRMLAWLIRLGGFVLMFIGFALIFKPLSVLADVVPFLGGIVGAGTGLVAFLLAAAGTALTIAIAWLAVRPLLGGALLAVAVVAIVALFRIARRSAKAS